MPAWLNALLMGQLRHLLTAAASALAAQGVITSDQTETLVGAVLVLVSAALSAWSHYKRNKGDS